MQHPNLKHRAMPDGGEYEDFSKIDFYSSIADKIENIQTLSDVIRQQFEPDSQVLLGDEINLNLLKQIDQNLAEIEAISVSFMNRFDFVKAADETAAGESDNTDDVAIGTDTEAESAH